MGQSTKGDRLPGPVIIFVACTSTVTIVLQAPNGKVLATFSTLRSHSK